MDLAEVESKVLSRKTYMKKWRGLTDDEVQEELTQIALERQLIEDSSFASTGDALPYPSAGGIDNSPTEDNPLEGELEDPEEDIDEIE